MIAELAGRWTRFVAKVIDVFAVLTSGIVMAIVVPRMAQANPEAKNLTLALAIGLWSILVLTLLVVQVVLLHRRGQTLGKIAMKIKITRIEDEKNGGFGTNVLIRAVVPFIIGVVPVLGVLFSLVDACFIFREDRRCIHDLMAKTHVIKA